MRSLPVTISALLVLLLAPAASLRAQPAPEPLLLLAGAASKPALEESLAAWRAAGGHPVDAVYGGSGVLLSQMKLSGKGDLYFPASTDFLEKARAEGLVAEGTTVVWLVPAICVARGNPKGIRGLRDLLAPGLRVAMAHPESVAIGRHAAEIADRALPAEERALLRANLITYTANVEALATALSLGTADAILGWGVLAHWDPERIEAVKLAPADVPRFGRMAIAVATGSKRPDAARAFAAFLRSEAGLAAFRKRGYFVTAQEAAAWAGEAKPDDGPADPLPKEWLAPGK